MHFHERFSRSLVKAFTFRTLIICSDAVVVFWLTHRYDATIGIVIVSNLASTFWYIVHERVWNEIHWGKEKKKK